MFNMGSNQNIKSLLELTASRGASDLHLLPDNVPTLRISTALVPADGVPLSAEDCKNLIYSFLSEEQKQSFEKEKELDLAYELGPSRFRINVHYERGRVAAAIRRIPKQIPSLDDLALPKKVSDFCKRVQGLVLVTGPTGSGKSSTQAAMIDKLNQEEALHIITVEDPIEYVFTNKKSIIEQREVGNDTLSFPRALKRVLRQDPDVILVGEMRDLDTIQTALTAAETGHLVISTLHTPDAAQAIDRIVDVFPPYQQAQVRLQLSMTLLGVIAQRLLPRKDQKGVVPAVEILVANSGVRNMIRKASTQEIYSAMEIAVKEGMQTMNSALKDLCEKKIIDADTALEYSQNPDALAKVLKGGSGSASGNVKFM